MHVIVFFDVCFLYLFCFSQVGILVKIPYNNFCLWWRVDLTVRERRRRRRRRRRRCLWRRGDLTVTVKGRRSGDRERKKKKKKKRKDNRLG